MRKASLVFSLFTILVLSSCGGGQSAQGGAGKASPDGAWDAKVALAPVLGLNDGSVEAGTGSDALTPSGGRDGGAGNTSARAGSGGTSGTAGATGTGAGDPGGITATDKSSAGGKTASKGGDKTTPTSSAGQGGTTAGGSRSHTGSGGNEDRDAGARPEDANAGLSPDGESGTCTPGSGTPPAVQTLVFVRHAETMENVCQDTCDDDSCCRAELCAPECDGSCSCDANVLAFSSVGKGQVGDVLVGKLKALHLAWDKILVSPTWRTQSTIKAYLEAENLCGQIVPELDECWSEDSGSCSKPLWSSETYQAIAFTGGAPRLVPRPGNSQWDGSSSTPVLYEHTTLACENIIMDRGQQVIENQFAAGAKAVLVVTHSMTGGGLLQRLTGKSSYDLENAAAYTVMTRASGSGKWTMVVNNAH